MAMERPVKKTVPLPAQSFLVGEVGGATGAERPRLVQTLCWCPRDLDSSV
jgi:hypothetical protein